MARADGRELRDQDRDQSLRHASWNRLFHVYDAFKLGIPAAFSKPPRLTRGSCVKLKNSWSSKRLGKHHPKLPTEVLREAKRSMRTVKSPTSSTASNPRCTPVVTTRASRLYKLDTCAAEFPALTPYYYSTFEEEANESVVTDKKKIVVLGSGPNRIGQGIEFDYCCVHGCKPRRRAKPS